MVHARAGHHHHPTVDRNFNGVKSSGGIGGDGYFHRRDGSDAQRKAYYHDEDDDNNLAVSPPQDCQQCDRCCACISKNCGCITKICSCIFECGPKAAAWAAFSLIFWGILWSYATAVPTTAKHLDLHVGETWKIHLPPLWSRNSVGLYASSANPGLEVYEFAPVFMSDEANCPTPNFDSNKKYHIENSVFLEGEEFKYDYFHLNENSKISVSISQVEGSANIYLIKGYNHLAPQGSDGKNQGHQSLRTNSVVKRFTTKGGMVTFTYEVQEPDLYTLVYDNVSAHTTDKYSSQLEVQIDIEMTTHTLPPSHMACSALDTYEGGCFWRLKTDMDRWRVGSTCIIIKAVSSDPTGGYESRPSIPIDLGKPVEVRLIAEVGSNKLLYFSSIPVFAGILLFIYEYGSFWCRRRSQIPRAGAYDSYRSRAKNDSKVGYQSINPKTDEENGQDPTQQQPKSYQHS